MFIFFNLKTQGKHREFHFNLSVATLNESIQSCFVRCVSLSSSSMSMSSVHSCPSDSFDHRNFIFYKYMHIIGTHIHRLGTHKYMHIQTHTCPDIHRLQYRYQFYILHFLAHLAYMPKIQISYLAHYRYTQIQIHVHT